MSVLHTFGRPVELFDPSKFAHRKWFAEFLRGSSWGHCPIRFTIESEGEMVPTMLRLLTEFYLEQEMGSYLEFGKDQTVYEFGKSNIDTVEVIV